MRRGWVIMSTKAMSITHANVFPEIRLQGAVNNSIIKATQETQIVFTLAR